MIGFMQGRLSPIVDGRIQAFPWDHWRDEFGIAGRCGFELMEWTLDQENLYQNPLLTADGRGEIEVLKKKFNVRIDSLTGDCFMEAPFYKASGEKQIALLKDFENIIQASAEIGIKVIVLPLVDDGKLENADQEKVLVEGLAQLKPVLQKANMLIAFESDFPPARLAALVNRLDQKFFAVNYDTGNSAALGFDFKEEIRAYGNRIANVHIKDRKLGGTTVPLGKGSADLKGVLTALKKVNYKGNFILQTARAESNDHDTVLCQYRDMFAKWLKEA